MNRIEFMKELEYLLQDIPEEETVDALDYYRDYLEEAGDEKEQDVLMGFGSPERIAAMIRSDLSGGMETGGEFTDQGFQDSRFEDPRYRLATRMDLPEERPNQERSGSKNSRDFEKTGLDQSPIQKGLKIALIIFLLCLASPFILGFGGTMVGILAAVASVILAVAISIAAVTFALFVAAVAVIGYGIATLFTIPLQGVLLLGVGLALLGLALLCLIVAFLFYGKLIPAMVRGLVNVISGIFNRRGRAVS